MLVNALKSGRWVNYTFLQKPSLFNLFWIQASFWRNFFVCKINDFGGINIWRSWWRRNVMRKENSFTVLYVTNGCFWKESLGWLLRNTRSCSRYLKLSPDFQEHIGYIFGGVRHHLRKIWSQEIELFSNENFQNLEIFSDFHHLPWKSKILDGEP